MATGAFAYEIHRRWGWVLALGLVQIFCGIVALSIPPAASIAVALIFGVMLVASGVFQIVDAFSVKFWRGRALHAGVGALYVLTGALAIIFPVMGAVTLSLIVAVLLIVDGVMHGAMAYRAKPLRGWGWHLGSAIASVVLGILLLVGWPVTGLLALGILLGVQFLISGVLYIAAAMSLRAAGTHYEMPDATHRHA